MSKTTDKTNIDNLIRLKCLTLIVSCDQSDRFNIDNDQKLTA